jgi:GNAT superfamily N-acetyltransferase
LSVPVRRALPADAGTIADLFEAGARAGFEPLLPSDFDWRPILETARGRMGERLSEVQCALLAEDEARPVGYIIAGPSRDPDAEPGTGEVWTLFVVPESWGTGAGDALMEGALEELARFETVTVWSFADNGRANAFYERHGFRRDGGERSESAWADIPEVRYRRP